MGLKLEFPPEVERAFRTNRAQSSGLSPALRYILDSQTVKREFTDNCVKRANDNRTEVTNPDAGNDRASLDAQIGMPLTGVEIERRIRSAAPGLQFEDSIAYPNRRLIYKKDAKAPSGKRLVAAMEKGWMPEFSVFTYPKEKWEGEPDETQRGWRTVIARCLVAGVLSETDVWNQFGPPSRSSERWHRIFR